jgi:hypothetical protein
MGCIGGAKRLTLAATLVAPAALLAASCALAQGSAPQEKQKGVCIQNHRIDHTEVLDENTILFHMIGGKIWKNSLTAPCHTLTSQDGFAYEPKVDQLCSNLEHIHVLRSGEVCLLGEFTPYISPPKILHR